jgi:hypothetical protein
LGLRRGKNTNLFAVGLLGASLCSQPAASVVPRSVASRRNAISPGRSGFNSRADRKEVRRETWPQMALGSAYLGDSSPTRQLPSAQLLRASLLHSVCGRHWLAPLPSGSRVRDTKHRKRSIPLRAGTSFATCRPRHVIRICSPSSAKSNNPLSLFLPQTHQSPARRHLCLSWLSFSLHPVAARLSTLCPFRPIFHSPSSHPLLLSFARFDYSCFAAGFRVCTYNS